MASVARLGRAIRLEAPVLRLSLQGFCSKASKPPKTTKVVEPPKAAAPKAATPKDVTPKTSAPKATAPKAAAPKPTAPLAAATKASSIPNYVSAATPSDPGHPVGPGALKGGDYPNTEYYTYEKMSYFDLEVEMSSHRIPQPSADNGQF
ncbi:translation initiation factor IF-2 [Procambarus clarkii]|uniref:translation initiation factor IF-2 n=1 Tax=Procambarus clarkii TaxID=6728 RepID=UPI003744969E